MRFLVDMNLSPLTVDYLNKKGYDAVHARVLGLKQAKDKELLKVAITERRIIITQDLDFGDLVIFSEGPTPGALIIRTRSATPQRVNSMLKRLLLTVTEEEIKGTVAVVEEDRVRIHERD